MTAPLAYSKTGAAAAAGVSPDTIARAIKSGRLLAKRTSESADGEPAGRVVILATELAKWLDSLVDA